MLSILTLPFVAYEKRKIAEVGGDIFELINKDLIRRNFIGSVNFCIEVVFILEAVKLTTLTHAVILASLK